MTSGSRRRGSMSFSVLISRETHNSNSTRQFYLSSRACQFCRDMTLSLMEMWQKKGATPERRDRFGTQFWASHALCYLAPEPWLGTGESECLEHAASQSYCAWQEFSSCRIRLPVEQIWGSFLVIMARLAVAAVVATCSVTYSTVTCSDTIRTGAAVGLRGAAAAVPLVAVAAAGSVITADLGAAVEAREVTGTAAVADPRAAAVACMAAIRWVAAQCWMAT